MSSKLGIAIDLNALEELMKKFIAERKRAHDHDTWREMYLSELLIWAQKRQQLTLTTTGNKGD